MEEATNLNDPVSILAEGAYAKKLEKKGVKLHGMLRINVKKDNSIQVMSLNVNGINMSKRFNHKADRLREVIHRYQLDAVGLQEICVNWDAYESSRTLASLLRRGYDPICSVQLFNKIETKNVGQVQRGGTATILQGLFSKYVKKTGKNRGTNYANLGRWSWYTLEGEPGHRTKVITVYAPVGGLNSTFASN